MHIGEFELTVIVTSPPWYENCYLVTHLPSGETVAVDPGGDAPVIAGFIKEHKLKLKEIWLTHGHPDHVGAVAELQQEFKVSCRAHLDEKTTIEQSGRVSMQLMGQFIPGPKSCEYFEGEPELILGNAKVKAYHTPGHTPGCVCFDFGPFTLTGDTVFEHGFGRTDLPGGNSMKLTSSITRLLNVLPPDNLLFSGHGSYWSADEAKEWWKFMAI